MSLNVDERLRLDLILGGYKEKREAAERDGTEDPLTEWEQGFIISTEERYNQYQDETRISAKQWGVLNRIYDKVVEL
jgi:hypothetical protein